MVAVSQGNPSWAPRAEFVSQTPEVEGRVEVNREMMWVPPGPCAKMVFTLKKGSWPCNAVP